MRTSRTEDPDMNPHSYSHLNFDKGPKTYTGEKIASSINVVKTCYQKTETRYMSFTLYKINSKWIKVLNIIPESLKLVPEIAGNTLELIDTGNDF
jgi:hypothetical protein